MELMRFGYSELSELLRVSAPLLMLDRLEVDAEGGRAVGEKQVSMDEPHFAGHFPGQPVMPGVLQVAAMCQASQVLFKFGDAGMGLDSVVRGLKRVKFRSPVRPGMSLRVECTQGAVPVGKPLPDGQAVEYTVKILADGQLASSGTVLLETEPPKGAEMFTVPEITAEGAEAPVMALGTAQIMNIIPHRYPFLLVDGAGDLSDVSHVEGVKNVSGNSLYVSAVESLCYEGYLQLESLAQLGCCSILSQEQNRGKLVFFMSIDSAEFRAPVPAGSRLALSVNCEQKGRFGVATGQALIRGKAVTETAIKFAVVSPEEAGGAQA